MELQFTFGTIASAIAKIFLVMSAGYALYYFKFIDEKFTDTLSRVLIYVLMPALIVSRTVQHFSFTEYPFWWFLPVSAVLFSLAGLVLGGAVYGLARFRGARKEFISSCAFQNCGYLPMNLILFSFAGAAADDLLLMLFLFIMGFNILMWSLVPLFLTGRLKKDFSFSALLNPPVVATLVSLVWVALFGKGSMPSLLAAPLDQLGNASFPMAMLTLGAYLCRHRAHDLSGASRIAACMGVKLIIMPAIVLAALVLFPLGQDLRFFLFLQSAMPVAVSLVVIGSYTGADNRFFSGAIFYSHVAAVFSVPLWLAVYNIVFK